MSYEYGIQRVACPIMKYRLLTWALFAMCVGVAEVGSARKVREEIDYETLARDMSTARVHYEKLKEIAWASMGGRARLRAVADRVGAVKDYEFMTLIGERGSSSVNPCDWLSGRATPPDEPETTSQMELCRTYVSHLYLLEPYLRRHTEVEDCSPPVRRRVDSCSAPGFHRTERAHEKPQDIVDCSLTCMGILTYISEKAPQYDAMLKALEGRGSELRRQREEEARRIIEEAKERRRMASLRGSDDCKAALFEQRICNSFSVHEKAKADLVREKKAVTETGYESRDLIRILEDAVFLTKGEMDATLGRYRERFQGDFDLNRCDGWVRGLNPFHPVQTGIKQRCGSY